MKRIGKVLVAAMMVGSIVSAAGCKKSVDQDTQREDTTAQPAAAPVEQPAAATTQKDDTAAPKDDTAKVATGAESVTVHVAVPAPPAARVEYQGTAPSVHHSWIRGYWRWDTPRTVYVWEPGYWQDQYAVAPYAPPVVRYEDPGYAPAADYVYVPGYWRWSGREYVWMGGRWDHWHTGYVYNRPRWEQVNGRWTYRTVRWDTRARFDHAYERAHARSEVVRRGGEVHVGGHHDRGHDHVDVGRGHADVDHRGPTHVASDRRDPARPRVDAPAGGGAAQHGPAVPHNPAPAGAGSHPAPAGGGAHPTPGGRTGGGTHHGHA